jgi:ketosteroid isomerase-like protein
MTAQVLDPARLPFAYEEALNAGDVDAVLALLSPGATMRNPAGEILTGEEALRAEAARTIAAGAHLTNKPRLCLTGDDTALIIVDWTLEVNAPDGTRLTPTGTTTAVGRRSDGGSWRFAILNPLGIA